MNDDMKMSPNNVGLAHFYPRVFLENFRNGEFGLSFTVGIFLNLIPS